MGFTKKDRKLAGDFHPSPETRRNVSESRGRGGGQTGIMADARVKLPVRSPKTV